MDFRLNDEQELFVDGVRELMASEKLGSFISHSADRESKYPERFVKALADMEIDNLLIPEEHGGFKCRICYCCRNLDGIRSFRRANLCALSITGGFNTVLREGTQEQIDKIMAFRGTGKQMWNSAITEPGAGSDVGSLQTTYTRKMAKVYLNGSKCFITSSALYPLYRRDES